MKTIVLTGASRGLGRAMTGKFIALGHTVLACARKWAIEGLTRALAQELPDGLAAIPLNPGVINTDMLQSCFGSAASSYPTPEQWAETAVPFLLVLGPRHNGQPLSV
jgi:NAD(P)-dependent dehydrogenase (short-subunit alcohol dehydrogenase family)